MNKKILIIIIIIVSILLIGGVACIFILNKEKPTNNTTDNKVDNTNTGVGTDNYQPLPEDAVYMKLFELFESKYPEDYDFGVTKEISKKFTLEDLENDGMDVSYFETDNVQCNKASTFIEVKYMEDDDYIAREATLDCIIK